MPDGQVYRFAYQLTGACVRKPLGGGLYNLCTGAQCPTEDSWEAAAAGWEVLGGRIVGTTVTYPDGSRRTWRFNAAGQTSRFVDAQGQTTTYDYNDRNWLAKITDPLGRITQYDYDAAGNRTTVIDPLKRITRMSFDTNWNRVTTTTRYNDPTPFGEANAQTFRTAYDVIKGVPIRVTTPLDRRTEMTYTARGQLETVKSPLANTTRLRYNDAGDAIAFIDALGNETAFGHDGAGRLTQFTDPLGFSTRAELNGIDQTTRITDALSQDTALAYDPAQRLASVTNARGNAIERYTYDAGDRLTRRTDALGKDTVYDYDSAGRLERMTDRTGRITRYTYDIQGRVIAIERPEGTQALTYDAVGRLTQIADETGSLRYEYDAADRVTAEVHTVGARTTRIEHTYDPLDRRTRRTVTSSSPDGNLGPDITDYGYDLDNRLTEVLYKGDGSRTDRTTYTWDADSRLTAKTLPNGITVNYTYDAASRLTALEYRKSDGTVIERLTYDFDAKGQIVARGSVNAVSQTETALTAEYDAADRMTSVTLAPGTPQARTYSLAYDADGNLTDKTHTADPADRTTFTWDSRQRLARLDAPGLTATFAYDVLGRRTERRITKAGEPARITQYVYDGAQAVGELRVAQGPITAQATSLITGLALDEALARVTRTGAGTPELRAFVTDHLGSVLAQAREDQSVATSFTYSAYGETAVAGEQPADSLGYTAREDDGTGLYFYRARHYDPVLKRFVQPLDFALGDACQRPFSSKNLSRLCVDIHMLSYVVSLSKLAR